MRFAAALLIFSAAAFAQTPEQRAIDYLAREAPRWYFENRCYSCHNNGDAVRVLYLAHSLHRPIPPDAFVGERQWLTQPRRWDRNRGNPAFSDKKLAWIQFSAALIEATKAGMNHDQPSLALAANGLARIQAANGSWPVDADSDIGSPVTWGTPLATYMARSILDFIDRQYFSPRIKRADQWFTAYQPLGVFESAVKLLAMPDRKDLVPKIIEAESSDGGWGPRKSSPSEPFDTAIVLLALKQAHGDPNAIARGRQYLIRTQESDGGWPETTRPPNGHSYAQHISTSAWATEALLITGK